MVRFLFCVQNRAIFGVTPLTHRYTIVFRVLISGEDIPDGPDPIASIKLGK